MFALFVVFVGLFVVWCCSDVNNGCNFDMFFHYVGNRGDIQGCIHLSGIHLGYFIMYTSSCSVAHSLSKALVV